MTSVGAVCWSSVFPDCQPRYFGYEVPADVAVKVQRPNIQATIERDIELLYIVARAIERSIPEELRQRAAAAQGAPGAAAVSAIVAAPASA